MTCTFVGRMNRYLYATRGGTLPPNQMVNALAEWHTVCRNRPPEVRRRRRDLCDTIQFPDRHAHAGRAIANRFACKATINSSAVPVNGKQLNCKLSNQIDQTLRRPGRPTKTNSQCKLLGPGRERHMHLFARTRNYYPSGRVHA